MAATYVPRSTDRAHLDMIRRFTAGETQEAIGASYGISRAAVSVIINRVLKADLKESGEPQKEVLRAYARPW